MIHQSLLRYRGGRYLWWAVGLSLGSVALYATQGGLQRHNGGTWQGYTLGTVGALLIAWLALLGIRKRSYSSTLGTVQGWASAHVYLGTALLVVATLHCSAEFGWNVHTLAYVLMAAVIVSGFVGLYVYFSNPSVISENRSGGSRGALFAELFDLDARARELADRCDPDTGLAVKSSIERTVLGGGVLKQLFALDDSRLMLAEAAAGQGTRLVSNTDQQTAIDWVAKRLPRAEKRAEAELLQALVGVLCRRQMILRRLRRDIRLNGWLRAWLYIHVPLTIALLAALLVHIVVTFIYW
ncbi:MAG TPA: hypothetical protein VJQ47_11345 [Steroidobacteraceae bacterium]|nr:hypothetical protein [Steroidobacteraceae bacterium]